MAQIFEKMDKNYQEMLSQIQTMNDLTNINDYVGNMYNAENTRVTHLKNSSVNNVYKAREQYSTTKYAVSYTKFITNAVIFTLGMLIVCGVLVCLTVFKAGGSETPMLSLKMCVCFVIVIVALFMIVMAMVVRQMMTRRSDDWDKRYFSSPPGVDAKASCNA
jgi:hypothetical protein